MTAAIASLVGLLVAIVVSMFSRINVGIIAITAAWIVGVYVAGMKPDAVLGGFPAGLFLTLAGVTFLFAIAEVNQSLAAAATRAFRLARGDAKVLPLLFFMLGFVVSAVGPGAVPGTALVIPLAMALGTRSQLPPMLTALMVANGANAGNLSPLSAVGIIANSRMAAAGIGGHEWKVMLANLLAHALVAAAAYLFYLHRIAGRRLAAGGAPAPSDTPSAAPIVPLTRAQGLTLAMLGLWILCVVVFKLHVGLSAFAAALILVALRACDDGAAIAKMPWGVIMMVCGTATLIAILESSGGLALFTQLLAVIATPRTVNGVIAFVTGVISSYSSTSGVVLPAFLPTVPALVEQVGGGDPLAVALSINVGSSLVDVSPLSTIGALCVAAVSDPLTSRRLFYQMLIWGLAMTLVGAALSQLFANLLAAA
jgi:di/tricarboxylate transporter